MRTRRAGVFAVITAALLAVAPAAAPAAAGGHSTDEEARIAVAPVSDAGSASAAPPASAAVAGLGVDVDDFRFDRLDVVYQLGRDAEGRSTLRTVEHFVAVFPDHDQNRGIQRAIPTDYDGHGTSLRILSVRDENGAPRDYVTSTDDDYLILTIAVPPSQYVHGEQHYVIEYAQADITQHFRDTDDDEFYWDVNGIAWPQPFGEITAEVQLADDLAPLVTETACYYGPDGSTDRCDTVHEGSTVSIAVAGLGPYENATLVVAFPTGTFAGVPFGSVEWLPAGFAGGILAIVATILFGVVARLTLLRDDRGRGLVIARYAPPDGVSLLLAAEILGRRGKAIPATMIDLAVRRMIRIIEREGMWRTKRFGLQLNTDTTRTSREFARPAGPQTRLLPDEQRIFDALVRPAPESTASQLATFFSSSTAFDADGIRWLHKQDQVLAKRILREHKAVRQQALDRGLRRKSPLWPALVVVLLAMIGLTLMVLTASLALHEAGMALGVFGAVASGWLAAVLGVILGTRRPLTAAGAEMKEHLLGLREFIGWAEADRLRMLQSVDGAERIALDGSTPRTEDRDRVVRLYERLLPYAILFGQEKQWAAALSVYYGSSAPDWYAGGVGAFSISGFSASMGSFSSAAASSSSSGGSGGGGSSGGGGGGGGGGGV